MTPYYEHAGITIYHGDCREILPQLGKFDLLLTDPPYGIGASRQTFGGGRVNPGTGIKQKSGRDYKPKAFVPSDWDDKPADAELIALCRSKADAQIIWGGNYFELPPSMRWLVWDKKNGDTAFADVELAWTNQWKAARIFRHLWNGMMQEHAGRFKEQKLHPTMKPLPLMKWCLGFFPEAKSVLDPFMGSGTTPVAAKECGLRAVGIEREEQYCEIAAKRLAQETLFGPMQTTEIAGERIDYSPGSVMGFEFL